MSADTGRNATFYNYRLLKKIVLPKPLIQGFLTLPFIWLIAEMIFISWTSIFYFVLAVPIVLWVHFVIARSVLIITSHSYRKRWRFTRRLPWVGYLPDQYVSYSTYRQVHLHASLIGLGIIAILIPWSPLSFIISLLVWHFWFLAPRLYILAGLKKQPKNGWIKFNEHDTSYYMS